ncbi:AAA family ATPase [Bacteroides acidifaciens]|uniref:McrB family protein n=1 Tax=Bacteroides acidifaciens TaxID=85831 RepID=UPI0025581E01|nr:AAA family ATPase [Bacteroides acidifaciens]
MATYYNIEMIGRVAQDSEIPQGEYGGRRAIFINKSKDIQYNIKTLSSRNGVSEETFIGYISSIRNLEFVDDEYGTDEDRIQAFSDFYMQRLFVFTYKVDAMGYKKVETADIVRRPQKVDKDSRFVAIPCFSGKSDCDSVYDFPLFKSYDSFQEFWQAIIDGKSVGRIFNFDINTSTSFPEFIVWHDNQKMCAIGPIQAATKSGMGSLILQVNAEELREIVLDDDESDDTSEYIVQSESNPTILHIAESKYLSLINKLSQSQIAPVEPIGPQVVEEITPSEGVSKTDDTVSVTELPADDSRELPTEKTEESIFEFFRYHSQMNKLFYNPQDITNFHTAIKTGSLVILSGMSGTGKSALVDAYAKALGIKNVLIIPVRPSWNDDSDLLGYVDLIHMVYRPSDTGFINKIVEASREQNKDKLYLICLDEMNLARVEHYFSQFLSILEKPVGSRELVLYDEQYAGQLYNSSKYPQSILIGDNVKFIGTVNIDESTYHFSDKVLDRANVITLDVLDYSKPDSWKIIKYMKANTPEWTNEDFSKLIRKDDVQLEHQVRIRELLWQMHKLLHGINANLGVGPRIVKSIESYLRNLPELQTDYALSIGEGLDYQISQRILTKIRGPEEQLKGIFLSDTQRINALATLLDSFSDISNFERSRKIIEQKENELNTYGYCL